VSIADCCDPVQGPEGVSHGKEKLNDRRITEVAPEWMICVQQWIGDSAKPLVFGRALGVCDGGAVIRRGWGFFRQGRLHRKPMAPHDGVLTA
jgi:hypothetical protein